AHGRSCARSLSLDTLQPRLELPKGARNQTRGAADGAELLLESSAGWQSGSSEKGKDRNTVGRGRGAGRSIGVRARRRPCPLIAASAPRSRSFRSSDRFAVWD